MLLWLVVSLLSRWRFQFSLRSLVVLVVAVAVPLGWFGVRLREAERQRRAVEAIRKAGGTVWYDYHNTLYGVIEPRAEPPTPAWLRNLLGEDFFADVVHVGYSRPRPSPSVFTEANTDVGDVDLAHVKGLERLKYLNLSGTRVTDGGLQHLSGLTRLEVLRLSCTPITDDGLEDLKRLTELTHLHLTCTQITDAGLEHLTGLTKLKYLFLDGTPVTDKSIEELEKALPNCHIDWQAILLTTPKTNLDQN